MRAGRGFVAGSAVLAAALGLALGGCTSGSSGLAASSTSGSGGRAPAASAGGNGGLTPATSPETVPSYYAEATAARNPAYDSPDNVSIRDTDTGTVVATIKPPRQYQTFGYVFATSSPDTWVAGAQPWHPVRLDGSAQRPGLVWLRVDMMAGGAVRSASRELATASDLSLLRGYSLTWLDDDRTLAIGGSFGSVGGSPESSPGTVVYVDTSSSAAPAVTRTIRLSFPPARASSFDAATAAPQQCTGAPIATSDGQTIICGGTAATAINAAGYTNVGIWSFSAHTGKLTAAWDRHGICCALSATMFPSVLWASPRGGVIVATGITLVNQGTNLYVRTLDGRFAQVPYPGLFHYPAVLNIEEPPVAW
ncbi:MAG TPA: hypothetical protein VHZ03_25270 [Trebonia sp.]|nr:hypothetical protein [Trebonia sp.]